MRIRKPLVPTSGKAVRGRRASGNPQAAFGERLWGLARHRAGIPEGCPAGPIPVKPRPGIYGNLAGCREITGAE